MCVQSLHPSSKLLESRRLCVFLLLWRPQCLDESLTSSYCSVNTHSYCSVNTHLIELNFISAFRSAANIWCKMTAESGKVCIRKDQKKLAWSAIPEASRNHLEWLWLCKATLSQFQDSSTIGCNPDFTSLLFWEWEGREGCFQCIHTLKAILWIQKHQNVPRKCLTI